MPALDTQTLLTEAQCYACYGVSITNLLKLSLLSRIANPAGDFIDRAGITDATQIAALNTLVLNGAAHGWWQKCDCVYPFVGGNASAHSQNLKSSGFTISWHGTVTHDANGITGDGTTGYGDTGYNTSSSGQLSLNSAHLGIYRRVAGTLGLRKWVANTDTVVETSIGSPGTANQSVTRMNGAPSLTVAVADLRWIVGSRTDSANQHLYAGGVDNSGVAASTGISNLTLYVMARNTNGTASQFSNANLSAVTIGSEITFAEYTLMAADWQAFQTSLGRQV